MLGAVGLIAAVLFMVFGLLFLWVTNLSVENERRTEQADLRAGLGDAPPAPPDSRLVGETMSGGGDSSGPSLVRTYAFAGSAEDVATHYRAVLTAGGWTAQMSEPLREVSRFTKRIGARVYVYLVLGPEDGQFTVHGFAE